MKFTMIIFPCDYFKIVTKLKKAEINKILCDNVELIKDYKGSIFDDVSQNKFEGKIYENEFSIQRIIYARNIFNPIIIGNIESEEDDTVIHINFEIRENEIIAFKAITSFLLVFQFLVVYQYFENLSKTLSSFIPTFSMILLYLIMRIKYNYETKSAKIELNKMFDY